MLNLIESIILESRLNFLDHQNNRKTLEEIQKPNEFIITFDSLDYSGNTILNEINDRVKLDINHVNNLKLNDQVLFTKDNIRVLSNYEIFFYNNIKIYSALNDFYELYKTIIPNFFKKIFKSKKKEVSINTALIDITCPLEDAIYNSIFSTGTIYRTNTTSINDSKPGISGRYYDGDRLNVSEKITILNNYVKVGYDAYEIYNDIYGYKYVVIGGTKYVVDSDVRNNKYLQKV